MKHLLACAVLLASVGTAPAALNAQEYDHNATFDYHYFPYETAPRADQVGYAQGMCSGTNGPPVAVMMWGYETPYYERVYVGQCHS